MRCPSIENARVLAVTDQAMISGCNFVSVLYLARVLSPSDFGTFSLALLCTLCMSNLHRATITQPMNVLGSGEHALEVAARLLALLRLHAVVIPLAVTALLLLAVHFFPDAKVAGAAAGYIACTFFQETIRRYWYTLQRFRRAVFTDLLAYGGRIILLPIAGSLWSLTSSDVFLIMTLPILSAILVDVRRLPPRNPSHCMTVGQVVRQHWPLSRWLVLTVLAVWGGSQAYPFLLSPLGPATVATFMACRNLLNATTVVIQSIDNYLPVRAAALLRSGGKGALTQHLVRTLVVTAAGGAAFSVMMVTAALPLLHLIYGGAYDDAAPILRILPLGTLAALMATVLGAYSLAMEDARASFFSNVGASAMSFTVGVWMVTADGIRGAAVAAVLTATAALVLQATFVVTRLRALPEMETAAA